MYRVQVDCSRCLYVESTGNPSATWASQLSEQDMGLATGRQVGRLVLGAFDLGRRLSSWRFAERIHRNRRILNVDDLEMLRLPWRAQVHAVAGARFHQRIGERRAPADVAAVEVHLVDSDDRDDVFEASRVLVGHGCAEEDARGGCSRPRSGGVDDYGCVNAFREKANPRIDLA